MFQTLRRPDVLSITLAAAALLMVTMGTRQSFGLFISPMQTSTGMGIASISLALAIGQFTWGAVQPIAGALADRHGSRAVLTGALCLLALGCALTPFISNPFALTVTLGLLASMGSGAGSFSVLIGAVAQRLPADARGSASGVINAGGSFGQFIFAPVFQKLIQTIGWTGSLWAMALTALAALPLINRVAGRASSGQGAAGTETVHAQTHTEPEQSSAKAQSPASASSEPTLRQALRTALKNPSYALLHAGFFTCGFHIAFLVTHLPGEVDLCGLPASVASWSLAIIGLFNIAGSLYAGACVNRYRSKYVLALMYASRAVLIAFYLLMPRTEWTYYAFAAGLGFTWLATVPPTAAIVGKLFGTRHLATLFGLTLLSHQTGGFLGAWLGGLALEQMGNYTWMWYADMMLALLAALVNLPIKESRIAATAVNTGTGAPTAHSGSSR